MKKSERTEIRKQYENDSKARARKRLGPEYKEKPGHPAKRRKK